MRMNRLVSLSLIDLADLFGFDVDTGRLPDEDVGGLSLLDSTLVFLSSEVEDGNRHRHSNLPVLLAGGEGFGVQQGLHQRVDPQTPIANLFVGMAHAVGAPLANFGDSNGRLDLIQA